MTGSYCVTLAGLELAVALGSLRATDTRNQGLSISRMLGVPCFWPDTSLSVRSQQTTSSTWLLWRVSLPFPDARTHPLTHPHTLPESGGSKCSSLAGSQNTHARTHSNLGQIFECRNIWQKIPFPPWVCSIDIGLEGQSWNARKGVLGS